MAAPTGSIVRDLTASPYNTSLFDINSGNDDILNKIITDLNDNGFRINKDYEGFLTDIFNLSDSLKDRQFAHTTRNPDFNLLGTNGYTPITETDGNDVEFSDKWNVFSGAGNAYEITPKAYPSVGFSPSGSNNFINFITTVKNSELYFYNKNYSTTGQFNSVGQYSGKKITFSTIIKNNNNNNATFNFSAFINDVTGVVSNLIESSSITLRPGYNLGAMTIQIPELRGLAYGANPFIQLRFNLKNLNGDLIDPSLDCDIFYLKSEISDNASFLYVDHILEQLICNNLT